MTGPYSRIYWSVMDDEKFDGIREDVRLFGAWALMLVVADMAWPVPAFIPPSVPRSAVARLSDCGLVDLLPGHRFRVHGLAAEREKRSVSARNAAAMRWQSDRNAKPMLDEAKQSKDEQSTGASIPDDDGRADLEAFLLVRHRPPTPRQREFMDAYQRVFDVTGPKRAERVILSHPDDPIGALKADLDAFRAERSAAAGPEPPKPAPRKSSGLTGVNAELARMLREREGAA